MILDQLSHDYTEKTPLVGYDFENHIFKITPDGTITVRAGYAWNYCSPQFRIFGVRVGAWNGDINPDTGKVQTYAASLLHDVLYDTQPAHGITRIECDRLFLQIARRDRFPIGKIYFMLMRVFGAIYWHKYHKKIYSAFKILSA